MLTDEPAEVPRDERPPTPPTRRLAADGRAARAVPARRTAGLGAALRWEVRKLRAQTRAQGASSRWPCWRRSRSCSSLHAQARPPKDTLFGRFATDNGFALALLVLGFAGQWVLPLLTAVVAGDIFASEDQHGTWKTVLTRSASRGRLFWAKTLAACGFTTLVLVLLGASTIASARAPRRPPAADRPHRAGHRPGPALWLVAASWASVLLPMLAFTALALLLSVWSRNPAVGIAAPVVIGMVLQLVGSSGGVEAVRPVPADHPLRGLARPAGRAPLHRPPRRGRRDQRVLVPAGAGHRLRRPASSRHHRRLNPCVVPSPPSWPRSSSSRPRRRRPGRSAGAARSPAPASSARCPPTFSHLYVQQAAMLGRDGLTPGSLHAKAMCDKHGPDVADVGPGADWVCLMSWDDPQVPMPPEGYGKFEVNVHSNDCYTVGSPSKLTGYLTLTDAKGREVTNPVFEFDGCFDPGSSDRPTGVSFPSLVSVTSTTAATDAQGRPGVQLGCGTGADGCAGTVVATAGGHPPRLGALPASRRRRPRRCGSRRRSRAVPPR